MNYLVRRLAFFVVTLWAAMTLNFFIPRLMPGSPELALRTRLSQGGSSFSDEQVRALLGSFGFKPGANLAEQYVTYLGDMVTGHWGVSIGTNLGTPVTTLILGAMPWTVGLVGITMVLAFIAGTLVGALAGWKRGGVLDGILPPLFVVTSALPYFWVALILILVFSVNTGWLPADFQYDPSLQPGWSLPFVGSVLQHAILPASTVLITSVGGWVLLMRNTMITTVAEDYVRMARAKGIPGRSIMLNYAARNAILPSFAGFAMSLGFVISGMILVEYVFNYPGLGHLFYVATVSTDYPLLQSLFFLVTLAVLGCVLLCDFVIFALDPRVRDAR